MQTSPLLGVGSPSFVRRGGHEEVLATAQHVERLDAVDAAPDRLLGNLNIVPRSCRPTSGSRSSRRLMKMPLLIHSCCRNSIVAIVLVLRKMKYSAESACPRRHPDPERLREASERVLRDAERDQPLIRDGDCDPRQRLPCRGLTSWRSFRARLHRHGRPAHPVQPIARRRPRKPRNRWHRMHPARPSRHPGPLLWRLAARPFYRSLP
jgi:hypothetical protein